MGELSFKLFEKIMLVLTLALLLGIAYVIAQQSVGLVVGR